jgi:hypothetical protein
MIGKIPTWWENSDRGNRKTARKNSAMVGNFPQREKKSLPLHGSFSTAAPVLYAGIYLPLFSQCVYIFSILNIKKYSKGTLFSLLMRFFNKQGQQASSKNLKQIAKL